MGAGLEDLLCRNKQFFSVDDFESHKTWKINGLGLPVCTMRKFEKQLRGEASDHSAPAVAHVMQRRQTVDMIRRALLLPDAVAFTRVRHLIESGSSASSFFTRLPTNLPLFSPVGKKSGSDSWKRSGSAVRSVIIRSSPGGRSPTLTSTSFKARVGRWSCSDVGTASGLPTNTRGKSDIWSSIEIQ